MLYAIDRLDNKIAPTPKLLGFCPSCKDKMIPKCGNIKVWHWSHSSNRDCDDWAAHPESDWHRSGKALFPKEWIEVVITKEGKRHRANVQLPNNIVIEFQKAVLVESEMIKRNSFYGKVLWVFDASNRENRFPDYHEEFLCLYTKDSLLTLESKLYYDFQHSNFHCTFKDVLDNPDTVLESLLLKQLPKQPVKIQTQVSQIPKRITLAEEKKEDPLFEAFKKAREIREDYIAQFDDFHERARLRKNWEDNFKGKFGELYPQYKHIPIHILCNEKIKLE